MWRMVREDRARMANDTLDGWAMSTIRGSLEGLVLMIGE